MARSLEAVSYSAEKPTNKFKKLIKDLYGLIFSLKAEKEV